VFIYIKWILPFLSVAYVVSYIMNVDGHLERFFVCFKRWWTNLRPLLYFSGKPNNQQEKYPWNTNTAVWCCGHVWKGLYMYFCATNMLHTWKRRFLIASNFYIYIFCLSALKLKMINLHSQGWDWWICWVWPGQRRWRLARRFQQWTEEFKPWKVFFLLILINGSSSWYFICSWSMHDLI
jgi:hypothetical protein